MNPQVRQSTHANRRNVSGITETALPPLSVRLHATAQTSFRSANRLLNLLCTSAVHSAAGAREAIKRPLRSPNCLPIR